MFLIGSAFQSGIDKWIMDFVHTKENSICCHIDGFSLVIYLVSGQGANYSLVD